MKASRRSQLRKRVIRARLQARLHGRQRIRRRLENDKDQVEGRRTSVIGRTDKPDTPLTVYNPRTLNRARSQLQLGDWESLAKLDQHELRNNPAGTELYLLAAVGHLQKGGSTAHQRAKSLLLEAMDVGADLESVARILIGSASNTLARLAALTDRPEKKVMSHFRSAIAITTPDADSDLLLHPMATRQLMRLARATGSEALTALAERTALNFSLTELHEEQEQVTTEEKQPLQSESSSEHDEDQVISIPAQVTVDGEQLATRLAPNHIACFSFEGGVLHYELPDKSPGYLVSNENGDFERPPTFYRIPLKPYTAYEITADIPSDGDQRPILWFFEYANGERFNARSYPFRDGRYFGYFRTGPNPEAVGFGIRVGGRGNLGQNGLHFALRSGTDVEIAETLQSQLKQMGSSLEATLSKNQESRARQNLSQLECFIRLQNYLGDDFVLPEMHGWAISPDFGVLLVKLLEQKRYDAIVEFGSGVSTVIVARILQKQQQRAEQGKVPLLSFDHLEQYAAQTREHLQAAGVDTHAEVVLAPLVPLSIRERGQFQYYDCQSGLQELAASLEASQPRVLVLVDGPPAATGERARYPALQCLLQAMGSKAKLDLLLDDYVRTDERNIVAAWEADMTRQQLSYSKEEFLKMEKQACLFSVGD